MPAAIMTNAAFIAVPPRALRFFFIIAHLPSVFNFFSVEALFLAANCYTVCVNKFF